MIIERDRVAAVAVLVVSFAVFRFSPIHTVYDSRYEMMFSQQLLWNHSFSLDAHAFPELQAHQPGQVHQHGVDLDYHLVQVGERFYYLFPPGSVIFSVPYVALANAFDISAIDKNGVYDDRDETRIEAGLAALLMAGFSVIVFLTSRLVIPRSWSFLVTAAVAFGTQVWSTASRAVWSQTWGIFILAFVIWLILRTETKQARLRPILSATCLSWLFFVRPTFGTAIIAITFYVLLYRREIFLPFAITGFVWLSAFLAYSEYHFGQLLPVYYQRQGLYYSNLFWEALPGNLISPSRGLLIYVPLAAFVGYLSIRYTRTSRRKLAILASIVILAHLIVISLFHPWHGGHCYGARLTTDLVPWFALLAILGVEGRLHWRQEDSARDSAARVWTESFAAAALLVSSVTLNGVAAVSTSVWVWNAHPTNIDQDVKRLWDWKHSQFLAAFQSDENRVAPPSR